MVDMVRRSWNTFYENVKEWAALLEEHAKRNAESATLLGLAA
jgi:hypothetical protein